MARHTPVIVTEFDLPPSPMATEEELRHRRPPLRLGAVQERWHPDPEEHEAALAAGIRIAVVFNIGVTAIAAYIGAGGLGTFISRGISQSDVRQLITGALALALLSIVADLSLLWLQRRLTPAGTRQRA